MLPFDLVLLPSKTPRARFSPFDWPAPTDQLQESFLRSSITSPDLFPGITSAGDLSAHHFPTKSASLLFFALLSVQRDIKSRSSYRGQLFVSGCFSGHCIDSCTNYSCIVSRKRKNHIFFGIQRRS